MKIGALCHVCQYFGKGTVATNGKGFALSILGRMGTAYFLVLIYEGRQSSVIISITGVFVLKYDIKSDTNNVV